MIKKAPTRVDFCLIPLHTYSVASPSVPLLLSIQRRIKTGNTHPMRYPPTARDLLRVLASIGEHRIYFSFIGKIPGERLLTSS